MLQRRDLPHKISSPRKIWKYGGRLTGLGLLWIACCSAPLATGARQEGAPLTLAEALRTAAASQTIAIAVDAEKVRLVPGTPPPEQNQPLSQTVPSFGQMTAPFGSVIAIAPAERTVLGTPPAQGDIYKDIPPRDAFALLAASLNDSQRQALLSEGGLGLGDLTSPMQRGLFLTLFPTQHLVVSPRAVPGQPAPGADQEHDIRNPMENARLRVGTSSRMVVHSIGSDRPGLTPVFAAPNGPPIYQVANQKHLFSAETVDGTQVHWQEPNALKRGQLDFEQAALQQSISLRDLKTVKDLIARIATQTKLELYADRRYEARTLTIRNAAGTARAGDVLRALCLWPILSPGFRAVPCLRTRTRPRSWIVSWRR